MPDDPKQDLLDRQREKVQKAIVDLAALRDTLDPDKQLQADRIIEELESTLGDDFRIMNSEG